MNYDEAVAYIHGKTHKGVKDGLNNMLRLLAHLGNPEKGLKYIHVAGTNGKGSTCAMLESMLRSAGYKTGLYTSPFLMRYNERMRVNNLEIPDDTLARLTTRIETVVRQMEDSGEGRPTVFEIGTALMFSWFAEEKVDWAVVEVGLGGRLDPTNVLTPQVSVIARIGLDHMKVLGDTLEQIAAEKGGIIKDGRPVVVQAQGESVRRVLADISKQKNAPLTDCNAFSLQNVCLHERGAAFSVEIPPYGLVRYTLPLCGAHQIDNAVTAIAAAATIHLPAQAVQDGLARVEWPGRLEWIGNVLLDGAHNPQGAATVRDYVSACLKGRTLRLLTGVMADKDVNGVAHILAPLADEVLCVSPEHMARSEQAEELAQIYRSLTDKPVSSCGDTAKAIELLQQKSSPRDVILICGSLYLVGEARRKLTESNR